MLQILEPGARRGGWSAPCPGLFTPGKETGSHCTGIGVGLGDGLNGCGKSCTHRVSNPGPSSPYPVIIPTVLSRPTHIVASMH